MVRRAHSDQPNDRAAGDGRDLGLEQFEAVTDDQGISLDQLSQAYAQLLGKGEDPYEPPAAPREMEAADVIEQVQDATRDDACELCPRSIVEAVLFVGHPRNEPMTAAQIAALMRGVPTREIDELIDELNQFYTAHGHPYQIVSVDAGYRLELREEFWSMRNVFYGRVREARLSQAAVDVLAIVAYQQGLTRPEIDERRGRPCGALLNQLVRRRLLRIERSPQKPRAARYYTTDRFLDLFGLASLQELPQSLE
ncbi:MAG: SMC-Scp complex subunit ScpB [Planctomycetaceae bacterium]|nr:SMC-Scp complex subunit ScpB [Planctomycetaceae bacterium]